jgi:hypothetical protein
VWAPEPVWTFWNREKSLVSVQIVATCFNHYMVILRPFKYIKTKITIATSVMGVRFRSPSLVLKNACQ